MTFEQIKYTMERIREFQQQKENCNHHIVFTLIERCVTYYADDTLIGHAFCEKCGNKRDCSDICEAMINKLQGLLDRDSNYPTAKSVITDIELYKKAESIEDIEIAIKKIYFTYSDRIIFGKVVESIVLKLNDPFDWNCSADKPFLDGLLAQIENYAVDLCNGKTNCRSSNNKGVVFNLSNTNNNMISQNAKINITNTIENAVKQIENACLSEKQEREALLRINELKKLAEFKDSQKSKWTQIKEIIKWVTEQGINVASIILPLILEVMK